MTVRRITSLAPLALLAFAACSGGEDPAATADANPCAVNPCAAAPDDTQAALAARVTQGDRTLDSHGMTEAQLIARGEELWSDASLSGAGATSCSTCHTGDGTALMNATFAEPYPHFVQMGKDRAGLDQVTAAEMMQLCMVVPMGAEPLPWDSEELAALAAYSVSLQDGFEPAPAAAANPCAANPCAANPCGG